MDTAHPSEQQRTLKFSKLLLHLYMYGIQTEQAVVVSSLTSRAFTTCHLKVHFYYCCFCHDFIEYIVQCQLRHTCNVQFNYISKFMWGNGQRYEIIYVQCYKKKRKPMNHCYYNPYRQLKFVEIKQQPIMIQIVSQPE